jgi:hypothetical protein
MSDSLVKIDMETLRNGDMASGDALISTEGEAITTEIGTCRLRCQSWAWIRTVGDPLFQIVPSYVTHCVEGLVSNAP